MLRGHTDVAGPADSQFNYSYTQTSLAMHTQLMRSSEDPQNLASD